MIYCYSLENKKNGFNKMREMYLVSVQTLENKTYDHELRMSKKLFQDTRQDLVNTIIFILILFKRI